MAHVLVLRVIPAVTPATICPSTPTFTSNSGRMTTGTAPTMMVIGVRVRLYRVLSFVPLTSFFMLTEMSVEVLSTCV